MSYPPIYVINLQRVPERKLHMQRQLDALNLKYWFIEAVDKYELDSKIGRTIIARQLGISEFNMESLYKACIAAGGIGTGNFACTLSHIKAYNLMIENNISKACVLEDDAYILPVFPKILVAAQKVPWDILMLFHHSEYSRGIISQMTVSVSSLCFCVYRLVRYKKYFPYLNPYIVRSIILTTAKWLSLKVLKLFNLKISQNDMIIYYAIGALPIQDRSTWYRTISNYHIAKPHNFIDPKLKSATAYMLTKSAAIKWRNKAVTPSPVMADGIDDITNKLSAKGLNLCICLPQCVNMTHSYGAKWSTRLL